MIPEMVAPCGINCSVCIAHMKSKNYCPGCHSLSGITRKSCLNCVIKNCEHLKETSSGFCYDCAQFPCRRLKQLDKRYRNNYKTSLIENLQIIQQQGLPVFLKSENKKWTCSNCGQTVSIHHNTCLNCNALVNFKKH